MGAEALVTMGAVCVIGHQNAQFSAFSQAQAQGFGVVG